MPKKTTWFWMAQLSSEFIKSASLGKQTTFHTWDVSVATLAH